MFEYNLPAEKLKENLCLALCPAFPSILSIPFLPILNKRGDYTQKGSLSLGARGNSDASGARDARWVRPGLQQSPPRGPKGAEEVSFLSLKAPKNAFMSLFLYFPFLRSLHSLPICFRAFQPCYSQ